MAYIEVDPKLPGIRGLFAFRPEIVGPFSELAEVLMRGDDNTLSRGERELIATYVSHLNECSFCQNSHGSLAQHYLQCDAHFIDRVKADDASEMITPKLQALLAIAAAVQQSGKAVTIAHMNAARAAGATDRELHDTVLIAALFCMCNRYVDGLGTTAPTDLQHYLDSAPLRAATGYVQKAAAK
jgi:uncharacterized peroxidase-related enzyme